jgi:hypothetical protein
MIKDGGDLSMTDIDLRDIQIVLGAKRSPTPYTLVHAQKLLHNAPTHTLSEDGGAVRNPQGDEGDTVQ